MTTNVNFARQAIQEAFKALHRHDRAGARRWAQRAAMLAPGLQEPWLILAAVSDAHAAQAYLEQALKINPSSRQARDGLLWLQKRQAAERKPEPGVEDTQPIRIADLRPAPTPHFDAGGSPSGNRPAPPPKMKWGRIVAATGLMSLFLLVGLALAAGVVLFYNVPGVKALALETKNKPQPAVTVFTGAKDAMPVPVGSIVHPLPPTPTPTSAPTLTPSPLPTRTPASPPTPTARPTGPKRIVVVISEQRAYAYQGSQEIYRFVVSTGVGNNTPTGSFTILDKIADPYSYSYGFWMPSWMGFYWVGGLEDGFHSLPVLSNGMQIWGDKLGTPASYGCVVLAPDDAQQLFKWADVGTRVEIRP